MIGKTNIYIAGGGSGSGTGLVQLPVPTVAGTYSYNGSEQTVSFNGYSAEQLKMTGTFKATNVGSYTVKFEPRFGFAWENENDPYSERTVTWSISKASCNLSANKTTVTLNSNNSSETVTLTYNGSGTVTAASSNASVASAEVTGKNVKISGGADGSAKITVTVAAAGNYLGGSLEINVTASGCMTFSARQIADDKGVNSDMVRIPKFTWKDLGIGNSTEVFPAFIVDGKEVNALYFGKYEASESNSRAYSVKNGIPKANINFDNASKLCTDKGAGWHMTTRLEWMAIALWCAKNGYQPLGNTASGKDENNVSGTADSSCSGRCLTGSGPVSWAHNNSADGIWDMCGNVWEWQTGIRLYKGELQVISKDGVTFGNDAAIVDSSSNSSYWRCINGSTGALMTPNGSGTTSGSIKCNANGWGTGAAANYSNGFYNATASGLGTKAQEILQALGLIKPSTITANNSDYLYAYKSDSGEYLGYAGGDWRDGAGAGVFALSLGHSRTNTYTDVGFRPAFVELPTA